MDRLTKRKNKKNTKAEIEMSKELTFTPKINKKSDQLDKKRGKSRNRYIQLHNLVSLQTPKRPK